MSVGLYLDENVAGAIARELRRRGVDVLAAHEDGRSSTPDTEILDRATSLGRSVFTRDQDFLIEAHRRQLGGIDFAGVVYADQTAVSIGRCVQDLEILAKVFEPADMLNRVVHLPL